MKVKDFIDRSINKIKSLWKTGTIQRSSRITYDIIWNVILFFLVIGIVGLFFTVGVGAGYFASLVNDEEIRSYDSMKQDIYNYEETTKMYFSGNKYFGDVQSDIHREEITLDEISDTLIDAVLATEDELFREHQGVVPKAIVRAVLQEAMNADTKTGGSTLTQQLIKNQILTNEVSFERKAKEILLALRLERFFEKDEILEAYLNIIPYGRKASGENIAGIQTAAQGIFGEDAKDVNLAQAAFLAGLPQSPSSYTPFNNGGGVKKEEDLQPGINRMKAVLKRMYDAGHITEEEYEEAKEYDIAGDFIESKKSPREKYHYLIDEVERRAIKVLKEQLIEEDGHELKEIEKNDKLNEKYTMLAERDLRTKGYHIHSTIDKEIYDTFQKVANEYSHYGPDRKIQVEDKESGKTVEKVEPVQAGAMLIDNKTGRIISFVGGRTGFDSEFNHATLAKRSIGSTAKPIAVYAPAMEEGVVQPGSVIADLPRSYPKNYGGASYGLVSAREALAKSYNVPAFQTYEKILSENPVKKYLRKMGITSLDESDEHNPALSLGGMKYGMTVEENVNAFATLGNDGNFVDAYMIEKITDSDGEVIYEHEVEQVEVFSPQTAYLTLDMMRDVIKSGTGSYLPSQLKHGGVDWAGKTGTSQDYEDAWFVGINPNVSLATWIGYDDPASIYCSNCSLSYSQRNMKLWAELINHAADIDPELVTPENRFKQPEGIVERSYCAISGLLPSDLCEKAGLVKSDIYNADHVPTKTDNSLVGGKSSELVVVDGKEVPAGANTPKEFTSGEGKGLAFNPEFLKEKGYDKLDDLSLLFPRTNRERWEKIGLSGAKTSSISIEDNGKDPAAPTSVSVNGKKVSWNKSSSKDVVGYRIFMSPKKGQAFKLIGHTTGTSISVSKGSAIFRIKAVDYFGRESSASNEVVVGNVKDAESIDKEQKKNDQEEKKEPKEKKDKPKEEKKSEEKKNDNKEDDDKQNEDEDD